MKNINEMFREIIALNEGGPTVAYKFSDPDGVRSGKSGWSFGLSQFDTQNNGQALACLRECGFTDAEIAGIVSQTVDVKPFAARLEANREVVDRYDMAQLQHCLNAAGQFAENYGIAIYDSHALLALADTVNQYGSLGNGTAAYCRQLQRPVTGPDILAMKLTWKYSQTRVGRADTIRRADNIAKVVAYND